MGKHKPAVEPFCKAITSKDIRDYKVIKHRSNFHFQQASGTEVICHHLCSIKFIHPIVKRTTHMANTHRHTQTHTNAIFCHNSYEKGAQYVVQCMFNGL